MKNKINAIIVLTMAAFFALACNASFTTANISSFNFGKTETANPPSTSFNVGEKVYSVATVSNASGKFKMKFKVTSPVKSDAPLDKDIDFEGSRPVYLFFTPAVPGEYKVEVVLLDESGKEIDKKSGTFSVKGESKPTTTDKPKPDADTDEDKDEKPADN